MKKSLDRALCEELPYWDFESDPFPHAILNDGSLVSGFFLSLKDVECLDNSDINQFALQLRSALNSLSEGCSVQFLFSTTSDYTQMLSQHESGQSESAHEILKRLSEIRVERLRNDIESGKLLKPELCVFVRIPQATPTRMGFMKKPQDFVQVGKDQYTDAIEALGQNLQSLRGTFGFAGLESQALSLNDLIARIYACLNPRRQTIMDPPKVFTPVDDNLDSETLKQAPWLAEASPREQLVFGDLTLGLESFTLDLHHHKVISLKTLPEATFAGQLASFLQMPFHFDLVLSFDVPNQTDEMTKLQQKRRMAHSLAVTQAGRVSDLESESKLSSTEELIRELLNTGQRIYAAQLTMVLQDEATPEGMKRLRTRTKDVLSRLRSLQGAEAIEESVGAWKVFKGQLPAAPVGLERARKMKTNNLADFLPVFGPNLGDAEPVALFRNRTGGLSGYNGFEPKLNNFNKLITGSSGSGKSLLSNYLLFSRLARGGRFFIIDIGGSYKKLTTLLDGQYFDFELTGNFKLNPFDLADPTQEPSPLKIKTILTIIENMVTDEGETRLAKIDRVLLEKEIIELFAEFRLNPSVPVLSDLEERLINSEEESLRKIGRMLFPWTGDRPYGKFLDGQGGLKPTARVCTFDLRALSSHPELQRIFVLILNDIIMQEVDHHIEIEKEIIVDEGWAIFEPAAELLEYSVRTLRKKNSSITFITQALRDVLESKIGQAIINNTATKMILSQKGDMELVAKTLNLNERQIDLIHSLEQRKGEFSEAFMIEGDVKQVIRITPSPLEYWIATSDARDNSFLDKVMAEGRTLKEAVLFAADVYPNGIAAGAA